MPRYDYDITIHACRKLCRHSVVCVLMPRLSVVIQDVRRCLCVDARFDVDMRYARRRAAQQEHVARVN